MKRFVYAPRVEAHIQIQDTGEVIDVSEDIISGSVSRRINAVSNASLILQNKFGKYTRQFKPMDRIVIWLTRTKRTLVFSGFLDETPLYQVYPAPVTIQASCTLKLLQNTYFDPGLPHVQTFFNQFGMVFDQASGELKSLSGQLGNLDVNNGVANALEQVLVQIGGWPKEYVHILGIPPAFVNAMSKLMVGIEAEQRKEFKQIEAWMTAMLGVNHLTDNPNMGVSQRYVTGGTVTPDQVAKIAFHAGFRGENLVIAVAVAAAESAFDTTAQGGPNSDGSYDWGLWQINDVHKSLTGGNMENMYDPNACAAVAYSLWKRRQGFGDWATYNKGLHLKYMRQARNAAINADSSVAKIDDPAAQVNASRHRETTASSTNANSAPMNPGVTWDKVNPTIHQLANQVCAAFPGLTVTATTNGKHATNSLHYKGMAVDIGGAQGTMDQAALWVKEQFGSSLLQGIHNPGLSIANGVEVPPSYWDTNAPGTWDGHHDHLHLAMAAGGADSGLTPNAAVGAIAGTEGVYDGATMAAIARQAAFFSLQLSTNDLQLSNQLRGDRALANDVSLFEWFQALATAAGREFTSMPDGSFLAFFPDYFAQFGGRAPYWQISGLEIIDLTIQLTDRNLATHVFASGSTFGGTAISINDRMWSTVASVFSKEFEIFISDKQFNAGKFLTKYGARPFVYDVPEIRHPYLLFIAAWQKFAEMWSAQYVANASFTFLPELFPGGLVRLDDTGVQMYIEEVTHNFDLSSGFSTEASLKAPATLKDSTLGPLVVAGDFNWKERAQELLDQVNDPNTAAGPPKDGNTKPTPRKPGRGVVGPQ